MRLSDTIFAVLRALKFRLYPGTPEFAAYLREVKDRADAQLVGQPNGPLRRGRFKSEAEALKTLPRPKPVLHRPKRRIIVDDQEFTSIDAAAKATGHGSRAIRKGIMAGGIDGVRVRAETKG